jgi:hypothetical protein
MEAHLDDLLALFAVATGAAIWPSRVWSDGEGSRRRVLGVVTGAEIWPSRLKSLD